MSDKFVLSQGLGHELETAFGRTGWSSREVKELTQGDCLAQIRNLLNGTMKVVPSKPFPIWKTVKLPVYRDARAIREACKDSDIDIRNKAGYELFDKISLVKHEQEIDLVAVSAFDLGFFEHGFREDGVPMGEVRDRGLELQLMSVPGQTAADLLIQSGDDLPVGHHLLFAMERRMVNIAHANSSSYPCVFSVNRREDGSKWIEGEGYDRRFYPTKNTESYLVFGRPR